MNDIISDAEIRHEQKHHRLGGAKKCVCCGEDDPRCLELHHIADSSSCGQQGFGVQA